MKLKRVKLDIPAGHDLSGLTFVIRSGDSTAWWRDGGAPPFSASHLDWNLSSLSTLSDQMTHPSNFAQAGKTYCSISGPHIGTSGLATSLLFLSHTHRPRWMPDRLC